VHRSGYVPKFAPGYDTWDQAITSSRPTRIGTRDMPRGVWVSAEELPLRLRSIALLSGSTDKQSGCLVGPTTRREANSRIFSACQPFEALAHSGERFHEIWRPIILRPQTTIPGLPTVLWAKGPTKAGERGNSENICPLPADTPSHARVEGQSVQSRKAKAKHGLTEVARLDDSRGVPNSYPTRLRVRSSKGG
jgi:hypothetical protein